MVHRRNTSHNRDEQRAIFIDTVFIQALLNQRDHLHQRAKQLFATIRVAKEIWITEAVLTEVGNGLSREYRTNVGHFINQCYITSNMHIVSVDAELFQSAVRFYVQHSDKHWGLTDCISFVVMQQHQLMLAVTADHHFVQAGFRALMLE